MPGVKDIQQAFTVTLAGKHLAAAQLPYVIQHRVLRVRYLADAHGIFIYICHGVAHVIAIEGKGQPLAALFKAEIGIALSPSAQRQQIVALRLRIGQGHAHQCLHVARAARIGMHRNRTDIARLEGAVFLYPQRQGQQRHCAANMAVLHRHIMIAGKARMGVYLGQQRGKIMRLRVHAENHVDKIQYVRFFLRPGQAVFGHGKNLSFACAQ